MSITCLLEEEEKVKGSAWAEPFTRYALWEANWRRKQGRERRLW